MATFKLQGQEYPIVHSSVFLIEALNKALNGHNGSDGEAIVNIINMACPDLQVHQLGRQVGESFLLVITHYQVIDFMAAMEIALHEAELLELIHLHQSGGISDDKFADTQEKIHNDISTATARYQSAKSDLLMKVNFANAISDRLTSPTVVHPNRGFTSRNQPLVKGQSVSRKHQ